MSTLRAPPNANPNNPNQLAGGASSLSPQTTPTSTGGFPVNQYLTPAYFDAHGQPTAAATKMRTFPAPAPTESYPGDDNETRTAPGDRDEDMFSNDTNYREADSVASMGAEGDHMDEEMATRSAGGYDDRMSDDGSASLVGFGEGANSTVSGPIYHRRPIPGISGQGIPGHQWSLERSSSGLSEGASTQRNRDLGMGGDTPVSAAALQERREARMMDGVATHGQMAEDEMFVDTTNRSAFSAAGHGQPASSREAVERLMRERLQAGEMRGGQPMAGFTDQPGARPS